MTYRFRTLPFAHQRKIHDESLHRIAYALLWEQGTGKTKSIIDTTCNLMELNEVDALCVVAPKNALHAWIEDEWATHAPLEAHGMAWQTSKARTQWHRQDFQRLVRAPRALLTMPYSALTTKPGAAAIEEFLKQRRAILALDEFARIKTPRAQRTRAAMKLRELATYRRGMSGTLIANSPFDAFAPINFLDPTYWKRTIGVRDWWGFRTRYGVFRPRELADGHTFQELVEYQRLDELAEALAGISSRVLKRDVLDLPPKLFARRYHELSIEQARVYRQLRDEWWAETAAGETSVGLAITRLVRLQQVICGYVPTDDPDQEPHRWLGEDNPRLEALRELVEDVDGYMIIWHRFQHDGQIISDMLKRLGISHGRYDGTVPDEEREQVRRAFQKGDLRAFVGNPAAAGEALNLQRASTVIYYSSSFNLTDRLQSEDRAHRAGQTDPVEYIDLTCSGTVDEHIISALVRKEEVARLVLRDGPREWLS